MSTARDGVSSVSPKRQ